MKRKIDKQINRYDRYIDRYRKIYMIDRRQIDRCDKQIDGQIDIHDRQLDRQI